MKKVEMAELRVVEAGKTNSRFLFGPEFEKFFEDQNFEYLFKNNIRLRIPFFGYLVIGCSKDYCGIGLLGEGYDGTSVTTKPLFAYFF